MQKQWAVTTENGTFHFVAGSKALAHSHAMTLQADPGFVLEHGRVMVSENVNEKVRHIAVRFVGWIE